MADEPDPMRVFFEGLRAWFAEIIRWALYKPPGPAVSGKLDVKFRPPSTDEKEK